MTDRPEPSAVPAPPLRVGILVDSSTQPAWIYRILSEIDASPIAEVVLVVETGEARGEPDPPVPPTRPAGHALYSLYTAVDRRLFGSLSASGPLIAPPGERDTPDAFQERDILELTAGVERITLGPSADIAAIRSHSLDVALAFSRFPGAISFPGIARWGIWTFQFGDEQHDGKPPGFWEVMEGAPVTGSALRISVEGVDSPLSPCRAFVGTDMYSVTRSQNNVCWTSSGFVLRFLRDIHDGRVPSAEHVRRQQVVLPFSDRPRGVPRNGQMCGLLARHGARLVSDRVRHKIFSERWVMAYHAGDDVVPLHQFRPLVPPDNRYWADPFPVLHRGEIYLFFEEQHSASDSAHIAVMKLGADGEWSEPVTVLRADYHLSYPHVFQWDGDFYMIPETHAAERVELYRCTEFPYVWQRDRVLLDDIRAVDTTVVEIDGRWWMFLNSAEEGARNCEELHLYSAPVPIGPWQPHRGNPVKSDARSTRPAGRMFDWKGRLLRPAQDCGGRYGRAIVVNEILHLDDDCFEEREVGRIEPNWAPEILRVHTFNVVPGLMVVDCRQKEPRILGVRRRGERPQPDRIVQEKSPAVSVATSR